MLDVRIGIADSPREIEIEAEDDVTQGDVEKLIEEGITKGLSIIWLADKRGKKVGVPASKIAYVEIGPNKADRRVGFGVA